MKLASDGVFHVKLWSDQFNFCNNCLTDHIIANHSLLFFDMLTCCLSFNESMYGYWVPKFRSVFSWRLIIYFYLLFGWN